MHSNQIFASKKLYILTYYFSGGFTKSGHPLILFPDNYRFHEVLESDLHLLLKYYISVVPRAEQVLLLMHMMFLKLVLQMPGFAIVIDRRNGTWQEVQTIFTKIVSLFPAKIKEVFLLYKYPAGQFGIIEDMKTN